MALSHPSNRLRALRKRLALSQSQLAFLLGVGSGSKISRYEKCVRKPGLITILALEVIFQKPGSELFARLYREVQKTVAVRARLLSRKLQVQNPVSVSQTQRETLARLIHVASKRAKQP
jgi:transcriptional regulator with XRE-family HTH domain